MKKLGIGGYRLCPVCKSKLKKNGLSKNKAQRGYCKNCHKSFVLNKKIKKTSSGKTNLKLFIEYLLNTVTINDYGLSFMQFYRKTLEYQKILIPELVDIKTFTKVMYLDAIYFSNQCCLIARNNDVVIGGKFCPYENADYWYEFIRQFPAPLYVVCDGDRGLMSAIHQAWPNTKHQRCLFHVWMNMRQKLTLHPETEQGKELLDIGRSLLNIKTMEEKDIWLAGFFDGKKRNNEFVSEKTINHITGEVFFTHKELRSAAGNLGKLILNHNLFYYLEDTDVSKTNNLLEGGINSRLKTLLYFHKGCNKAIKRKIIEFYLLKRSNYGTQVTSKLYNKKRK